ncbi:DUF6976 family protein [Chachezhania sediminis]|uniref:DUF6976 family protein n=1 Tax=Chachezhania sediminis TaxID=2599291 RepID=UPI00131EA7A6|nr:hypothetical protein [Chachezhania sediminis]
MKNALMSVPEAAGRIRAGAVLMIAGSEQALKALPAGSWIGGTSVYFVAADGGRMDKDNVFVTELDMARDSRCQYLSTGDLHNLTKDRFDSGLSLIILPGMSAAHQEFALHGASYRGLFDAPLMGWISGVHLDDLGTGVPKVIDGGTGRMYEDGAVLLHVRLPAGQVADLDIVNLFVQDRSAPRITFAQDGFSAHHAFVDGQKVDFADWVARNGIDTQLPLVADYAGAMINVSFQSVDAENGRVDFYAPVIAGMEYRQAKSPGAYADVFAASVTGDGTAEISCNCILNYLYGKLEGHTTGSFTGPATFGEIAYILMNQTMVRLSVRAEQASQVA